MDINGASAIVTGGASGIGAASARLLADRGARVVVIGTDGSRQLREQGMLQRAPDGNLRLSPRAMRRLGETALRSVVSQLRSRRGERGGNRRRAASAMMMTRTGR